MMPLKQLRNQAYTSDTIAYNQRLAGRSRPEMDCPYDISPAITVEPDGTVICRFYAPSARSVKVGRILDAPVEMTREENGIWVAQLRFACPGVKILAWWADDVEALNPYAPYLLLAMGDRRTLWIFRAPAALSDDLFWFNVNSWGRAKMKYL